LTVIMLHEDVSSTETKRTRPHECEAIHVPIGFVVIGRNEGERLKRCIESLQRQAAGQIIYVDSGSTDGSVEYAESRGVTTVALDLSRPFTMGRARNTGFNQLLTLAPGLTYVQFVDGDCEVDDGWVAHAVDWLEAHPEQAALCGHLRERYPRASVYNRLFDIETRGPFGSIDACGGVAMYRVADFARSGGFEERMIAGEEPELCSRLRRAGRGIWRSRQAMALHDANMHSFKQWWLRAVRCGHAYADRFAIEGVTTERYTMRAVVRGLIYGLALPFSSAIGIAIAVLARHEARVGACALALQAGAWTNIAMGAYRNRRSLGDPRSDSALYAVACIVTKTPEALGAIKFARNRLAGRQTPLIEYRRVGKA
jgi:GT2 family glycosyltransferase